jgi:hypothetical protein
MKAPRPRAIEASGPPVCPTCREALVATYCPACGERALRPADLTLRGLLHQVAQTITSIDGPLLRSARCLVTRPGVLTVAYLRGQRKPYTLPLPLFLAANVLFFAMQTITGAKLFSTPLRQHLENDIWGGVAQQLVSHRLAARQATLETYAPVFDQAVELNAKSLIVAMVLPFALLPALVFYRSRKPFAAHVVFSLHFYAFLMLLLCVSLAITGVVVLSGGQGLASAGFDHALSIAELMVCAAYLYIASGTVYGARAGVRLLAMIPLAAAVAAIYLGYRFLLLLITLYST